MNIVSLDLSGAVVFEPTVHRDDRGFFVETLRAEWLEQAGHSGDWVQDNHSRSVRGVLRGLHYQTHPGQVKLVRCARGSVLDVVVDVRQGSPTFGRWASVVLDDVDHRSILIPIGFAHGFVVLSDVADVVYRCSAYYDPATEAGFRFDDPEVGVEWPTDLDLAVSERDRLAPSFAAVRQALPFEF
ncbi:MAG: dTDP-4-dehydrorhamnose 3,5-epimerase [Thermoleophilia bacterium]